MKIVNVKFKHHGYQIAGVDKYKNERAMKKSENLKRDADICLNCTKPTCKGSERCFEKKRGDEHGEDT